MEDISMEDISIEEIKKNLFNLEEHFNDAQKRNICYKLKHVDESIVKEVKNLYQVYNILFQTKKIIIRNQDFNFKKSINDLYKNLNYNINLLREEIYKYIMLIPK